MKNIPEMRKRERERLERKIGQLQIK